MSVLKEKYEKEIRPQWLKRGKYPNAMCVPVLEKIVISMGVAKQVAKDKNILQDCIEELALIAGQRPIIAKAKKAISNFKLRIGQPVGLKVTLRGKRMYDFLYRFTNIICPRIRDFRGLKKKGDGRNSYHIGITDHQIFPELNLDKVKTEKGMNIAFVTTAKTADESLELLTLLGLPFRKPKS